jgi:hypothetical protein
MSTDKYDEVLHELKDYNQKLCNTKHGYKLIFDMHGNIFSSVISLMTFSRGMIYSFRTRTNLPNAMMIDATYHELFHRYPQIFYEEYPAKIINKVFIGDLFSNPIIYIIFYHLAKANGGRVPQIGWRGIGQLSEDDYNKKVAHDLLFITGEYCDDEEDELHEDYYKEYTSQDKYNIYMNHAEKLLISKYNNYGDINSPETIIMAVEQKIKTNLYIAHNVLHYNKTEDYNKLEEIHALHISNHFKLAGSILENGGSMILNYFGISSSFMIELMYYIYNSFDVVEISKPSVDKPDNGIYYIVCMKFNSEKFNYYFDSLIALQNDYLKYGLDAKVMDVKEYTYNYLNTILEINANNYSNQITFIRNVISLWNKAEKLKDDQKRKNSKYKESSDIPWRQATKMVLGSTHKTKMEQQRTKWFNVYKCFIFDLRDSIPGIVNTTKMDFRKEDERKKLTAPIQKIDLRRSRSEPVEYNFRSINSSYSKPNTVMRVVNVTSMKPQVKSNFQWK